MDVAGSPNRPQPIANSGQLGGKVRSITWQTWLRVLNHAVIISPTMLSDVFIGVTEIPEDVGGKLGKQSDDVAIVSPSSKDNGISLGHRASPQPVG